jgi:hypothetical protein
LKYSYGDNEEILYGMADTREQAIAEAMDDYPDAETIYVGEATQKTIGGYLTAHHIDNLLESLAESAQEECGEVAADWLSGPKITRKRDESNDDYRARVDAWRMEKAERTAFLLDGFRLVLEVWASDRGEQPNFWHVDKVEALPGPAAESI